MKRMLSLGALALICTVAQAATNVGIAYGDDASVLTNKHTEMAYDYWVAGTPGGGLVFQNFLFVDTGNGPGGTTIFNGSRLRSFQAYFHPFFGKVADFWVEGQTSGSSLNGRTTWAHVRVTDSDYPGATFAYFAIDLYLPNGSTPIFSRIGFTFNETHILIASDAGGPQGPLPSSKGLAYSNGFLGITNRAEPALSYYNVAYNYLYSFIYEDTHIIFLGDKIDSFICSNTGLFGKNADFWLEGRTADSVETGQGGNNGGDALGILRADCQKSLVFSGPIRLAHVYVSHSSDYFGVDTMFIAFYHPANLNIPLYERAIYILDGYNNILCR